MALPDVMPEDVANLKERVFSKVARDRRILMRPRSEWLRENFQSLTSCPSRHSRRHLRPGGRSLEG